VAVNFSVQEVTSPSVEADLQEPSMKLLALALCRKLPGIILAMLSYCLASASHYSLHLGASVKRVIVTETGLCCHAKHMQQICKKPEKMLCQLQKS
jgi:hypothetical protein